MNDLIRELVSIAPALGMGIAGRGAESQSFMEGFNRMKATLNERERQRAQAAQQQTIFSQQQQDRDRAIQRQTTADRYATEDRARALEMQKLGIMPQLAELGATGDTPEDAQHIIETAIPGLMKVFGQETMGYGMPAVEMATRTITARQKRQVSEFVDAALKTSYVADNPDADPEISNLPDHIKRVIGAPSARLSELQKFAQLPVGKPAKRPGDDVSWQQEDALVGGKLTRVLFNPKTREYKDQQGNAVVVDPVPPRQPASPDADETKDLAQQLVDGYLVPSMLSRRGNYNNILAEANRLSKSTTGNPYNAARAQTEYAASQRFMSALNGPQQQRFRALAGSVVNTIDEVKELSREMKNSGVPMLNRAKLLAYSQAMGNTPQGQLAAKYVGAVNTLKEEFANLANGGYAPNEAAWELANQQINGDFGVQQMESALSEVQRLINYRMQSFDNLQPYGVTPTNPAVAGIGATGTGRTPTPTATRPAGPVKGERRKFGNVLGEWDGEKWVEVKF